jgi:hypothetical protein
MSRVGVLVLARAPKNGKSGARPRERGGAAGAGQEGASRARGRRCTRHAGQRAQRAGLRPRERGAAAGRRTCTVVLIVKGLPVLTPTRSGVTAPSGRLPRATPRASCTCANTHTRTRPHTRAGRHCAGRAGRRAGSGGAAQGVSGEGRALAAVGVPGERWCTGCRGSGVRLCGAGTRVQARQGRRGAGAPAVVRAQASHAGAGAATGRARQALHRSGAGPRRGGGRPPPSAPGH